MGKTINRAKRGFAVLLSVCMVCGMTPLAAKAEETVSENAVSESMVSENMASGNVLTGIKYLDKDGKEQICKSAVAVTAEDTTWGTHTDGSTFEEVWYVVNQDVTIDRRVTVADKVHLILMDGCTLTVNGGIEVQKIGEKYSNVELYIYAQSEKDSMGKLKAVSALDAATVGGEPGRCNGWIYFNGGDIEIENTGEGAAFGQGGRFSVSRGVCIYGGRVEAKAKSSIMKNYNIILKDTKYWRVTSENQLIEKDRTWSNTLGKYCLKSHRMVFEPCTEHTEIPLYKDENNHTKSCKWCGYVLQEETHHYDDQGYCGCGAVKAAYRTENGDTAYAGCRLLEDTTEEFNFPDKWYVVLQDVTLKQPRFRSGNDVNIIITEGATLTMEGSFFVPGNVSIYGTGTMAINGGCLVCEKNLTINDAEVNVELSSEEYVVNVVQKLRINRGRLSAKCTADRQTASNVDVIHADSVQLNGEAALTASDGGRAFSNNNVTLDPDRCWEVQAGIDRNVMHYYQSDQLEGVYTDNSIVRIRPRTDEHQWMLDAGEGKHECTVCKRKVRHTTAFTADTVQKTITGQCLDEFGLDLGSVTLNKPKVPDGRMNITYDGGEHKAGITGEGIAGITPEIIYSYQAPGTESYVQMTEGETPVNAGHYIAAVSLTGADNKTAEVHAEFTIEKAVPVVTWQETARSQSIYYTGSESAKNDLIPPTVTLTGTDSFGDMDKIAYSYRKAGTNGDFISGLPTEAGTYEVKAEIPSIGNYTEAESADVMTLDIMQAANAFTTALTCDGYTYEKGKTPAPGAKAEFGSVTYKYASVGTEGIPTDEGAFKEEAPVNAGTYAVKAYVQETDNYAGLVSDAVTFTIARSPVTPHMPKDAMQPAHRTATVGEVELPADWRWKDGDQGKTLADNVPVTATAVYTGEDRGNYVTESIMITLTRSTCDHEHTRAENEIPAACMTGGFSGDIYCADCNAFIRNSMPTEALGHAYGTPEYTWETDATGKMTCTASKSCTRMGCTKAEADHTVAESVRTMDTVTKEPTCTDKGIRTYTAVFTKEGFIIQTKTEEIATVAHELTAVTAKEATVTETGNQAYFVCNVCGKYFEDGEGTKEITDKSSVVIPIKEETTVPVTDQTATQTAKPVGTKLKDSTGAAYKVTNAGSNPPTVQYVTAPGKAKGTVTIPSTVTIDHVTYKVTAIADNAFKGNKKIKKIVIGSNIVSIGKNAFAKCTNLTSITIGKNVTKIGKNAFTGCKKLKTITIKSKKLTAKSVAKGAFNGISEKAIVKVPKSKYKAYKKLLCTKGLSKKAPIKKF